MIEQSDQTLIRQIVKRDADAFETLFARHSASVRQHILSIVRVESAVEDLVQEVFLRVWMRAEQWNGQGEFKGWLFRIATNLALNHLRMLRRRRQEPLETPPDEFDDEDERPSDPDWMIDTLSHGPEVIVEQAERSQLLWQLVDGLPQEKQEVLHLIYQKEMALREAAIELGIPEGTVKSHLRYAIIDTKRGAVIVLLAWKILTKDNVNRDGIT